VKINKELKTKIAIYKMNPCTEFKYDDDVMVIVSSHYNVKKYAIGKVLGEYVKDGIKLIFVSFIDCFDSCFMESELMLLN
jgi:hypothetical protein